MSYLIQKKLIIGTSGIPNAGYGVFTLEPLKKGEIVCECPTIKVKSGELLKYIFDEDNTPYLCLGFGTLFNHSDTPNLDYKVENDLIIFFTTRDIDIDEELFIDYGEEYNKEKYFNPA